MLLQLKDTMGYTDYTYTTTLLHDSDMTMKRLLGHIVFFLFPRCWFRLINFILLGLSHHVLRVGG